jgi:2-haloacid dehalogenase
MMSLRVYVFDAYGTLLDVHSAVNRFRDELGDRADPISQMWRIKQLEYTWTYALMGRWRDFRDLTADALEVAAATHGGLPAGLREKLVAAYDELDGYPDVAPALRALRAKGVRTAILSNGSGAMLDKLVHAAGLADLLDAVISTESLKTYKPQQEVYGLVGQSFGARPNEVAFLSSNRWDIAGATSFGFHTIWVNRTGKPDEYAALAPARVVGSLAELDVS